MTYRSGQSSVGEPSQTGILIYGTMVQDTRRAKPRRTSRLFMACLCGGLQCRVGGNGSYWTVGSVRGCVRGCGDAAVTLVVSFSYDCSFCMG